MIHGRFQPFHNGHLAYLCGAAARCDELFVGITNPDVRRAAIQATSVNVSGKIATTRLPNSTNAWWSAAGKNAPGSHPGQPSQPSPDPVSLTAAPLRMIR